MDENQHEDGEEAEGRRPKVVDKRISARGEAGKAPPSERPAEPPPAAAPPPSAPSEPPPAAGPPPSAPPEAGAEAGAAAGAEPLWTPEQEAQARKMAQEMAEVPSIDWVINVAVSLANAAGVKLNSRQMEDARLAIDALAGLMGSVGSRLEDAEAPLRQTLAELQMAYTQIAGPSPQPPQP